MFAPWDQQSRKKTPCLVRSWQLTIKVFTPEMSAAESRGLKEKIIRGEKKSWGCQSRPMRRRESVYSDLQEIILLDVLDV